MSDDWKIGDEAMCINHEGWFDAAGNRWIGPRWGEVRKVAGLLPHEGKLGLQFDKYPRQSYDATGFKKLDPYQSTDEDEETIYLYLKKREQVPA